MKVRIIFPTAPLSNIYVLGGLSKIVEIIRNEREHLDNLEIHFLFLLDFQNYPDHLKIQLKDHYEHIVEDVEKNLVTIGNMQKDNFLTLFNHIIMSISDISVEERLKIISKASHYDIKKYLDGEGKIFKGKENFYWNLVDTIWNDFRRDIIKRVPEHIKDIYFNDQNPIMKYLLPIRLYKGGMKVYLVVVDEVEKIIEEDFVKGGYFRFNIESNTETKGFTSTEKIQLDYPVAFHTIYSEYVNSLKYPGWEKNVEKLKGSLEKLKSELFPHEGNIGENISKGFLTIQRELFRQLSFIV